MIDKIRYWCNKILPLVYDDSLSYYEVLCKISAKLNEVIDSTNGLLDAWNAYKNEIDKAFGNYTSALDKKFRDFTARIEAEFASYKSEIDAQIAQQDAKLAEQDATISGQNRKISDIIDKVNAFILKYNEEIAKIPDMITEQVNAWWHNEDNYNKLVVDITNNIGAMTGASVVNFTTVSAMTSATAIDLPANVLAVCSNYYGTDGICTLWYIVSGDMGDNLSRLTIADDTTPRTAILLSERNADTLGLHGASATVGKQKLLDMYRYRYRTVKIVSTGVTLYPPSNTETAMYNGDNLTITADNRDYETTVDFKASNPTIGVINNITGAKVNFVNTVGGDSGILTLLHGRFDNADVTINAGTKCFFNSMAINDSNIDFAVPTTFTPNISKYGGYITNSNISLRYGLTLKWTNPVEGDIAIEGNTIRYYGGQPNITLFYTPSAGAMSIRDNCLYSTNKVTGALTVVRADDAGSILDISDNVLRASNITSYKFLEIAACADFALITESRNGIEKITGSYMRHDALGVITPYSISDAQTTAYLRCADSLSVEYGTPLVLTYPDKLGWSASNSGEITLSNSTTAQYMITISAQLSVTEVSGTARVALGGDNPASIDMTIPASGFTPLNHTFYATGGTSAVTLTVSALTQGAAVTIANAEVRIIRIA